MAIDLSRTQLEGALAALGTACREDTTILLGGSAALILTNALERGTNDGDVIASHPDLGHLQAAIRAVARELGLPDGWLNGSVQSYVEVLPPDYETRVKTLRPFGRLSVSLLGRRDVIVMKFFSGRPKDLRDLEQIAPTAAELAFIARELPRLAEIDPAKAKRMHTVLDAWPSTEAK
ncbi:MAG TPA: DUF6036 family nucleotidyltransferase [Gemmatimonadaceae bacterium]|nr:DUF6036 family nucleotidyltransferase [Gemmatimonadaceae bacterium]